MMLDYDKIKVIARLLKRLLNSVEIDDFTDPRYYPPPGTDKGLVTAYFLVLVAMDHRLSRPNRPYEAVIEGARYHGADLLYRLGMHMFNSDPGFFEARRLSHVSIEDVKKWLAPREFGVPTPVDLGLRAKLLRDLGVKLCKLYECDPYNIILESRGKLRNSGDGFIEKLKVFTAFQDPVEKKAFLLAKFLERRRILEITDPWNKEVPVDNHVARLALRWGIVNIDKTYLEKIASKVEFSFDEDVILRYFVRMAFKLVSQVSGIDPFVMDDFLWSFGRTTCKREKPACRTDKACPLSNVCAAYVNPLLMIPEHQYYNTWFY